MPDTVGCATPEQVYNVTNKLVKKYPKINIETHFHNDRGLSYANTLQAVKAGATFIDTSIWGLAERSGINSTTGTLLNLYLENKNYVKGYKLNICYPLNVLMASILNTHVPYNEPVSLTNRTHIAGVHTGAVIKNAKSYEATNLQKFGVTNKELLLGPLSGWNVIYYYLKEVLYYETTRDQAKEITQIFKEKSGGSNKFNQPKDILNEIAKNYPLTQSKVFVKGKDRVELLDK
jgi:homocitrate synthase